MLKNPYQILLFLALIEGFVFWAASQRLFQKLFNFLPQVFWIYFLPMLASSVGLIDPQSPILAKVTNLLLPASLFLLLICVDLKMILRLGPSAIGMFFVGAAGIMLGTILTFAVFQPIVGHEFWRGFGALSASWTGGSANMIAVKEALNTPENVFLPMVVVDTIVPYVWMGILMALAASQIKIDQFFNADQRLIDDLRRRSVNAEEINVQWDPVMVGMITALAIAGGKLIAIVAQGFPVVKDVISPFAWTIILVSMVGLAGSLTSLKKLEKHGSTKIGYIMLYFVLTTIGARASISNLGGMTLLVAAGFMIVSVHAIVLVVASKFFRVPLFLAAVASQANIGGVASAPIVAETYQKNMASIGLLLAILGNIVGTYLGVITAQICRMFVN